MSAPLTIVYYGNPLLRKRCELIETVTDEIRTLAYDMVKTMDIKHGIGLAGPQVGRSLRIFVLRNYQETPDGRLTLTAPQVYINPKLSNPSEEMQTDLEGCLSMPGLHVEVTRPLRITVEALDIDGEMFKEELEGYKARVVMHENDHLNGVLHIDRIDAKTRKSIESDLQAIKKKYNK